MLIWVDLISYESKTTDKRGQCDWRIEKNLNGHMAGGFLKKKLRGPQPNGYEIYEHCVAEVCLPHREKSFLAHYDVVGSPKKVERKT